MLVFQQKALVHHLLPLINEHPLVGNKASAADIAKEVIALKKERAHHDEKVMARIFKTIF